MKRYLEFYDKTKTYYFPNFEVASPSVIQANYASINVVRCVIETDSEHRIFSSIITFSFLKAQYEDVIDFSNMSDTEILKVIENKMSEPVVVEPTAEERIASAMEYQNLMM